MYLPSNSAPCAPGPLPAGYNAGAAAQQNEISNWIAQAQGAFNAAVDRLDLGPNGLPWGSGPMGAMEFGLGTPPLNITWPAWGGGAGQRGGGQPGSGYNPNPAGGPGAVGPNGAGGSNPRVVDYPQCSPVSLAAQFSPPQPVDDCVSGVTNGYVYAPIPSVIPAPRPPAPQAPPAPPVAHPPPAAVITPNPRTKPARTGDICADLRSGAVLQSDVEMAQVYACSQAGFVGVGPSDLDVVQAGLSGLGNCGNPNVCSGNPRATPSPADRARMGTGIPWWGWALAAAGVYAMTTGNNKR